MDFEVNRKKFVIRLLTGSEYDEMIDSLTTMNPDGTIKLSIANRNKFLILNAIEDAPFENWKNMTESQKLDCFNNREKMDLTTRTLVINEAVKLNIAGDELKK